MWNTCGPSVRAVIVIYCKNAYGNFMNMFDTKGIPILVVWTNCASVGLHSGVPRSVQSVVEFDV